MYYDPGTGDIGLFSDDASVWYWATPGAAGATVSNHQCTVDAAHGSVQTTAGGGVRTEYAGYVFECVERDAAVCVDGGGGCGGE